MTLLERFIRFQARRVANSRYGKSILTSLAANIDSGFSDFDLDNPSTYTLTDPALQSVWVNICVWLRAKNIQRTMFRIYKKEREIDNGPIYDLFSNPSLDFSTSASAFWFNTSMWLDLEGEFFWWFGEKYSSGIPKELHVINPRSVTYEKFSQTWWYNQTLPNGQTQRIPLSPDEFIHVWEPNPWSPNRGVSPIAALAVELEQDIAVTKEHLHSVRNSAIPDGILKTEQRLTPDQAQELQDRYEREHGRNKKNKRIAVLGSNADFKPLNADLLKFMELKSVNRVAIATKYGIPLKVLNIEDSRTALSGKDSNEQYKALWSQTLIPHLKFLASEVRAKFFSRFGLLNLRGEFDTTDIPELQIDEADLHTRLREDIKVNLITINEAREMLHRDPVPWGDQPFTGKAEPKVGDPKEDPKDKPKKVIDFRWGLPIAKEIP